MKKLQILLCLGLCLIATCTSYSQNLDSLYNNANNYIDKNNYSAALMYLDSIDIINSDIDSVNTLQAYCYLMYNEYDIALKHTVKAISLNPKNDYAYYLRGVLMSKIKLSSEEQRKIFTEDVLFDTSKFNNLMGKYKLVTYEYNVEIYDYESAIKDLSNAIAIYPKAAEYYHYRGRLYQELRKYREAEADYTYAIQLEPKEAYFYQDRGLLYKQLKKASKSLVDFDMAIELKPDEPIFYANRGYLKHEQLDDKSGACNDLNKATHLGFYIEDLNIYCE